MRRPEWLCCATYTSTDFYLTHVDWMSHSHCAAQETILSCPIPSCHILSNISLPVLSCPIPLYAIQLKPHTVMSYDINSLTYRTMWPIRLCSNFQQTTFNSEKYCLPVACMLEKLLWISAQCSYLREFGRTSRCTQPNPAPRSAAAPDPAGGGDVQPSLSLSPVPCRELKGQWLSFWLWLRQHAALASRRTSIFSLARVEALHHSSVLSCSLAVSCRICLHGGLLKSPGKDESKDRTSPSSPVSRKLLQSSLFY